MSTENTATDGNVSTESLSSSAHPIGTQSHLTTVAIEQTWTIDHFTFYVSGEGEFKPIFSAPFSLGDGYSCRLILYPNGPIPNYPDHIALYLQATVDPPGELSVNYQFSIIDKDGQHTYIQDPLEETLTPSKSRSCPKLIARSRLLDLKNGLLVDDQLKIHCGIKASFKKFTSGLYGYSNTLQKLSLNLAKLLDNGQHSDVIFCVDGTDIPAHKLILCARSPVFASMFEHKDTKEAQEGKVIVEDVDVDTFKVLLQYLYSGQIPDKAQLTAKLLAVSNKFLVDDLKLACEEHLSTTLTIDSAATMLLFADTHNAPTLKANCLHYIIANATKVMATDGWNEMVKARPELVNTIFRKFVLKTEEQLKQIDVPNPKRARLEPGVSHSNSVI